MRQRVFRPVRTQVAAIGPKHWAIWLFGRLYYLRLWRGYIFNQW